MVKKSGSENCTVFYISSGAEKSFCMDCVARLTLRFQRISPRRQWPRRWFLWAVCRIISSALSWIPSLMIFEIRLLFVVCVSFNSAVVWPWEYFGIAGWSRCRGWFHGHRWWSTVLLPYVFYLLDTDKRPIKAIYIRFRQVKIQISLYPTPSHNSNPLLRVRP